MLCFLCGKKIGFLRSLVDQQYCSSDHRKEARLASAQAFRDEEENESWVIAKSKEKKGASSAGQTASVFAFLTVAALLVAAMLLPGPGPGNAFPSVSLDPSVKRGLLARLSDGIGELVRSRSPITMRQTFSAASFTSAAANLADWSNENLRAPLSMDDPRDWLGSGRRTASLRLWKRTTRMQNYQMEFEAQLQQTSLSWAFRALDGSNHYATSLAITKPGPQPNASLVRYVMFNGREYDRVQLPIPVTLKRGEEYRVRVTVQDDRFVTYLNGKPISSWHDKRLVRGGIGFFNDERDPQNIKWVALSERDSFLGRLLGHFGLFLMPGDPAELY